MINEQLTTFCKVYQGKRDKLIFQLEDLPFDRDETLTHALEMLDRRIANAEIRLLVLGPLKSGKSTFMNVLTKNAKVSQVSPLPAYPCVVEVECLEAHSSEGESTFYCNGEAEPPITLAEGLKKLDGLLEIYISQGGTGKPDYEKICQKIRASGFSKFKLTLIDSPGLLFGEAGYSDRTKELLDGADLAVFIIRPEQLFFSAVREYLEDLAQHAGYRRVFILVNASAQAKNFRNGMSCPCDQISEADKFNRYFNRHIAGDKILAAIQKGTHFSIDFTDLLAVGEKRFAQSGCGDEASPSGSDDAIDKLEQYLCGTDLGKVKSQDIEELFSKTVTRSLQFIQEEIEKKKKEWMDASDDLNRLKKKIEEQEKNQNRLDSDLQETRNEIANLNGKAESLENYSVWQLGQDYIEDPLWRCVERVRQCLEETEPPNQLTEGKLTSLVEKIYVKWSKGGFGAQTLLSLASAVWSSTVEDNEPSLSRQAESIVRTTYDEALKAIRKRLEEDREWGQILADRAWSPNPEPYIWQRDSKDLLPFPRTQGWLHWIGYLPEDLWGSKGEKTVSEKFAKGILTDHSESIRGGILHNPWNVVSFFSTETIRTEVSRQIEKRLKKALKAYLQRAIGEKKVRIESLEKQIKEANAELDALNNRRPDLIDAVEKLKRETEQREQKHREVCSIRDGIR